MKKNLFGWLAMAAMLVGTGCSTDEVVNDYSPENAIQFGTYVGRDAESRVSVTTIDVLKASSYPGFGVFANYSTNNGVALTPNFINNTQVTWNTSAWTYSPVKYWPNNATDQVTFWAYGPWDTNNTVPNADAPHFAISDGTDYVAAGPVTKSKSTIEDKVTFNFAHMMSKVGFKVEAIIDELEHTNSDNGKDDEGDDDVTDNANKPFNNTETTIVVTSVELKGNLYTSGTYTWSNDKWSLERSVQTNKEHELTAGNFAAPNYYAYDNNSGTPLTLHGQLAQEDKSSLNNVNSYLMLVPQSVGINITVAYSVITRDENLATGYSKVDNVISSGDFNFTFEGGKAYNFVLHLGLTSVKFNAEVSPWENANDVVVNVPINTTTTP